MKWASVLAEQARLVPALEQAANALLERLGQSPDLVMAFVSGHYRDHYARTTATLLTRLDGPLLLGCSAGGVIGAGRELEQQPAVALLGACLSGVQLRGFHLDDGAQARILAVRFRSARCWA